MSKNLVILPGHSVWIPSTFKEQQDFHYGFERSEWELVDFQIEGYDHLMFIEQILKCLILADKTSTVIISGGYTKKNTPDISESKSYMALMKKYFVALSDGLLLKTLESKVVASKSKSLLTTFNKYKRTVKSDIYFENIYCEEYALDSFDNLYYSLAFFRLINGDINLQNLESVKIVGFAFKEARFQELHWKFLGGSAILKDCKLVFDSNKPNTLDEVTNQKFIDTVYKNERKYGYDFFVKDPYARKQALKSKKQQRNIKKHIATEKAPFKKYLFHFSNDLTDESLMKQLQQSALYK